MPIRRVVKYVLLTVLVSFLFFFLVVVPWFFTNIITASRFHFHDPNDSKTPLSYGMPFQEIEFGSSDGIRLKGWYAPGDGKPRGTVIYCHGHNRTRVEMLPMAVFGHSLGYNGLLFDFRHAGQSGGKISTLGYNERLDVIAAVRYALDREKAARPVALWGVSMGAAAALMAASECPQVAAVISDSSFVSFREVIVHHAHLFFHIPAFPIVDEAIYWSAWRGGFRPSDFDLRKAVQRINPRPILFIAVEGDKRIPPSDARQLYSRSDSPGKKVVIVPGSRHGEGFNSGKAQYERAVQEFLQNLRR